MNHLGTWLMPHLDRFLQFIEFNSSIEGQSKSSQYLRWHCQMLPHLPGDVPDYLQIARCLEGVCQQCCQTNHDLLRVRDQLRQSESERSVLEVKLKHARNQVEVEMKKRHRAEAELEMQERKMHLIYDYLMADPDTSPLNENQYSALAAFTGRCSSRSTLPPGRRLSVVEELGTSIVSDISFDHSDDEVDLHVIKPPKDLHVIKPAKGKERRRSSLTPLIQPVVLAKRARSSLAPAPNAIEMSVVALRSGAVAESRGSVHSLPPVAVLPCSRTQQNHCISTFTDLATVWGTSEKLGGCSSQAESDTVGKGTGAELKSAQDHFPPPPPQEAPLLQHHFTSKTVICLEFCAVCKLRLRFGKMALKCRPCQLLVHPECKDRCPSLCVPDSSRPRVREGILAEFAPSTPPLVPPLVIQCVSQVEKRGLQETGLYRVPGMEHLVREWKHKLLRSRGTIPSLDHVADVNVICGILKAFLRGLKEPLVTFYLHSAFLNAAEIPDESARYTALCHVVMKLPPANRDTLAFLMLHLHRVMESPKCQMDQHNLSRVFGPTLIGHSTPRPTPLVILEETPRQFQVVANLLALPCEFWKRFVKEEQENLVPSVRQSSVVNEQGKLFRPLAASEINTVQMSPGSGCLPKVLCADACPSLRNVPRTKKTGKFFPLPT